MTHNTRWPQRRWPRWLLLGSFATTLGGLALTACAPAAGPAAKPAPPAASSPSSAPAQAGTGAPAAPAAPASAAPTTPPAPIAVRAAYAAPAGALTPVFVAQEQGLFREYGLDVDLNFLSGPRTDQGVLTGETPLGFGATIVNTRLGGGDIVAVAGIVTRMPFTFFGRPGLTSMQDVRGKTVVTALPGSSSYIGTLLTLRHYGLDPARDVQLQPTQSITEQQTIMMQGLADGANFSPPAGTRALELGFVPLANMAEQNIPFLVTAIGVTPAYARDHAEEVRRFLRASIAAVGFARREPEATKAIISKYTQYDDPVGLDETYRLYSTLWGRPDFRVPPAAIEPILRALDHPNAATAQPAEFVDNRFVDELEQAGFMHQVGAAN
jgi:NitT/TauT family transport system substrate-binding protein